MIITWKNYVLAMKPHGTVTAHECGWCSALVLDKAKHEEWHQDLGDFSP